MQLDALLCGPVWNHLTEIVKGEKPVVVTAFYGAAALVRLEHEASPDTKLLVRFPSPGLLPKVLPNDPVPLLALIDARPDVRIYGDPGIHAKVYVSSSAALLGSANLSNRGFSGGNEAALFTRDKLAIASLRVAAETFISKSLLLTRADVKNFADALSAGKCRVSPPDGDLSASFAPFAGQAGNPPFEAFLQWLSVQAAPFAQEAYDLCTGKNNLSGHAFTAYNGLAVMFRGDPSWARGLAEVRWNGSTIEKATARIRTFVAKNPGAILGKRGANWENYLPEKLGGPPRKGGTSTGLVKRLMVLVPRYLRYAKMI